MQWLLMLAVFPLLIARTVSFFYDIQADYPFEASEYMYNGATILGSLLLQLSLLIVIGTPEEQIIGHLMMHSVASLTCNKVGFLSARFNPALHFLDTHLLGKFATGMILIIFIRFIPLPDIAIHTYFWAGLLLAVVLLTVSMSIYSIYVARKPRIRKFVTHKHPLHEELLFAMRWGSEWYSFSVAATIVHLLHNIFYRMYRATFLGNRYGTVYED